MKRYTITIHEVGQEKQTIGSTWEKGAGETPDKYGYTPEVEATRDFKREIYTQTVDELDIAAVVSVVNGLV